MGAYRLYLYTGKIVWSLLHIHSPQSDADSTGRNEDDIVAVTMKLRSSLDD